MDVFGSNSKSSTAIWGPTASVEVSVPALGFSEDDDWILAGLSIGAREIVDIRQCFNDVSYIYALGNDQGKCQMTISLLVFLGAQDCQSDSNNTARLEDSIKSHIANRISENTSPTTVTIGSFSRKGWLVGTDIGQFDMNKATCVVTGTFVMQLKS